MPVGGYQVSQSESFNAVVFKSQVLLIQESVDIAVIELEHGMLFPIKPLHVIYVPL